MNGLDDQESETAAWEFFRWQRVSAFVQSSSWYNFVWKTIITLAWGPPIISKNFMCSNFTYMCEGGMFYFSNFVHLITLGQTCSVELIANINVLWRNFNIWAEPKCELMNSNPNLLIRTNASKALCERLIMWCTIFSKSQLCVPKQMPVMCEEVWISVTVIGCSLWISVFEYSYTMCMTLKCCPLQ